MVNQEEEALKSNHQPQSQVPPHVPENGDNKKDSCLFSPRFKSVVAMAGWDEEALLSAAALIVDDTPDRLLSKQQRKRLYLPNRNSPLTNSTRKRRAKRRSLDTSMPVVVLSLDDDDDPPPSPPPKEEENSTKKIVEEEQVKKEIGAFDCKSQGSSVSSSSSNSVLPCIDRLREELSCAICLEICYEPSTTPCGHSFCKRCLRSAANKCGKRCPKCRQFISNGRSCTVNTVLWNTIQMLFPQEIEARKASLAPNCREAQSQNADQSLQHGSVEVLLESASHSHNRRSSRHNMRRRSRAQPSETLIQGDDVVRRTIIIPSQDEDAALALRMQREEFMGVLGHRRSDDAQQRSSLALARENLRAMASRATSIRLRGRTT